MSPDKTKTRVFYSYSHKDEKYRTHLEEHLAIFKRAGLIDDWSDRKILPGGDWRIEIDENLDNADVVLVLISSSFIASDYCYDKELALAMERHEAGRARLIPIFIRPTEWQDAPFAGIQGLPKDALPISQWDNEDLAWQNVAAGLRTVLREIREQKQRPAVGNETKTLHQALTEEIDRIDALYTRENGLEISGMPTSLIDVDRLTNGLNRGDLCVIASRPSMGKTNLALMIAGSVAEQNLPVLIFSMKTAALDISRRMLTTRGMINYATLGSGNLADDDWPKLTAAIAALMDKPVLIDDSPTLTLSDLRTKCLCEKKKQGALALVVIDSVDYLTDSGEKLGAGRFLKALARELDTALLVTAHVTRSLESRPNKRPILNDIHKTDLADEADIVAFLYIDTHYNSDSPDYGIAELIIAKNPRGPVGTVRLAHMAKHGGFYTFGGAT
jgi:replicative DNA helicase